MQPTITCADTAGLDALDTCSDEFGIAVLNGLIEIGREDQPFAGSTIIRPQLLAQHGVVHVVDEVIQAGFFDARHLR